MAEVPIHGTCDTRFAAVRGAFAENFARRGEVGAAVAVTLEGRPVVDLWGGAADAARTRTWGRDTIVHVFSTTKGLTALCAHVLADRKLLDLDAPVADHWPEFAAAGKAMITVRHVLSHRAGLPAIRTPLPPEAIFDWSTMTAALAAETPWWEPGTRHGYHLVTYGWLVGEVVRRVSGKSLGAFFRDEVATPLGLDCHIGLAAAHEARTAETIAGGPPGSDDPLLRALADPGSLFLRALSNPPWTPESVNTRAWRAAEIPAVNAHTNARAVARLYGALASGGALGGVRLLGRETLRAVEEQCSGPDVVTGLPGRLALGFGLGASRMAARPNPRAFGHPGAGGSVGFADPDAGLGFGYTPNQMGAGFDLRDPRTVALIDAVYASL
jgi:CubicO group peptidase (beta-lactamase class C family)